MRERDDQKSPEECSLDMGCSISLVSRQVCFEKCIRGKPKYIAECWFAMRSSITSASRNVGFERRRRVEQKPYDECSLPMGSSISWVNRIVYFANSKTGEQKYRTDCLFAMWSSICWASCNFDFGVSERDEQILLRKVRLRCDLPSYQRVATLGSNWAKEVHSISLWVLVFHVSFNQVCELQGLLRSQQKRWTKLW